MEVLPTRAMLSTRVSVVRGCNPGPFTLQGTNTYIVGTGRRRLLIDTGDGPPFAAQYVPQLRAQLRELDASATAGARVEISDVVITHHHHDHVGGLDAVLNMCGGGERPRLWRWRVPGLVVRGEDFKESDFEDIEDGTVWRVDERTTLRAQRTPGHCSDHICLFLEEESALFSADCILGQGSTVFENLGEYMRSLRRTAEMFPDIKTIYPGHGPVLSDGISVVHNYIKHRQDREDQILKAIEELDGACSSWDIVKFVYKGYPEHLWRPAEQSVLQHLGKLLEENRVAKADSEEPIWSITRNTSTPKM